MATKSVISSGIKAIKSNRKFIPTKTPITLTPAAISRVKELLSNNPESKALRVGVKQRGCNGLTYTLEYATTKNKFDEVVEQNGIKIYIDAKAQLTLLGTEMDYVSDVLSSEFVFNNPNIKGTCGCGESFQI
jgi:iron-sulfur cluster assembly 1